MFFAFFVWLKAYRRRFPQDIEFLLVLFSFSVSYQLVYYAAELKQYSMDLLIVGLFCLFIGYQKELAGKRPGLSFIPHPENHVCKGMDEWFSGGIPLHEHKSEKSETTAVKPRSFIILTILIPVLLLFSYASLFLFWIIAYNFLLLLRKNKEILPLFLSYTLLSVIFLILLYIFDIRFGLSENCLFDYWKDYFLCTDSAYCFIKSFMEGLRNIVAWPFGNSKLFIRLGSFFIPFFILALLTSIKSFFKEAKAGIYSIEAIGLIIFIELFFLGLIKKYPFTGERVTLFFMPFVFLMIVKGIGLFRKYRPLYLSFTALYCSFLIFCGLNSLLRYLKPYL